MPGKSRHGKGKRFHYSKKSKAMMRQGTGAAETPMTAAAPEMLRLAASVTATPASKAAAPAAKAATNPYPFITNELRRIALLAGIIIVILVVLSIILT